MDFLTKYFLFGILLGSLSRSRSFYNFLSFEFMCITQNACFLVALGSWEAVKLQFLFICYFCSKIQPLLMVVFYVHFSYCALQL